MKQRRPNPEAGNIDGDPDAILRDYEPHNSGLGSQKWIKRRNLIAFWFFGLCNNFSYVIMLSAAHDILTEEKQSKTGNQTNSVLLATTSTVTTSFLQCNPIGTGTILLADIIPSLLIKLTAPLYIQSFNYSLKICFVVATATASFLIVAFAPSVWLCVLGVCFASVSSGFGEVTFLSFSSFYNRNVISTWSSGTGGAGIFGALAYAGTTQLGISPRHTILMMLVIPAILSFSYFVILERPPLAGPSKDRAGPEKLKLTWKQKLKLILPLLKFMIPLCLVYVAEYFINQGLFELLYFNGIWLSLKDQYRWYQVDYQLGVFISRSSVNLLQIKRLWIPSVLQIGNLVLLMLQIFYQFITNIWIMFALILFEGLLGGAAYVNTFYQISGQVEPDDREYSLGVASMADTFGILLAGMASIPVHNKICSLHLHKH